VDVGERTRKLWGKGIVVDSLIYIVSFAGEDYSIYQQGSFADVRIGVMDADEGERRAVAETAEILSLAGVDYEVAEDIEQEIWRKYILNCAFNVATAAYDNTIGELRDDPAKTQEYKNLVWEAYAVARAKGVHVMEEHARIIEERFYKYAYDATSSLQRDVRAGKPSEVDVFSGYLVRTARALGVDVPVSEKMYGMLRAKREME
jgi:2-dehydropantoate 2-reductase